MRILFASPRQCWPAVSGAKLRDYHFAKALGAHAAVTYVYFSDVAGTRQELPFCESVISVPKPAMYTPMKVLRGILGRVPLPLLNYTSPDMMSALRTLAGTERFDLVHFDSIHMMPYEHLFAGVPVVYDWHNIESELMWRYAETATPAKKALASLTARKIEAAERQILGSAFGHLVCSEREREALAAISPGARVQFVPNGVDLAGFASSATGAGRFRLVFVGSMAYHANSDGAVWFAREVWPTVRERHPEWRLTLVGSNPPPAVVALREQPGIEVTGTVPEVTPYYGEALAAIVPLRTGGGTRLKILEAMAAGVPVISTEPGAEGLPVVSGENLLLVKNRTQWLEALELATGNQQVRSGLIEAARVTVADFDWQALGSRLFELYRGWLTS